MKKIESLLNNLKSKDESVLYQTIEVLGDLQIKEAVPQLLSLLSKQSWRIRKSIVDALGKIKNIESLNVLVQLLKDDSIEVHSSAIDAIIAFGKDSFTYIQPLLNDEDVDVRILISNIYGFIGEKSGIQDLVKQYKIEKDVNVKYAIIESLGRIKSLKAADLLINIVKEEDFYLQLPAIIALGQIRSLESCNILIKCLNNELLKLYAIEVLGDIGELIALVPLLKIFNETDDAELLEKTVTAIVKIYINLKTQYKKINSNEIITIKTKIIENLAVKKNIDKLYSLLKLKRINNDIIEIFNVIEIKDIRIELIKLLQDNQLKDRVKNIIIKTVIINKTDVLLKLLDEIYSDELKAKIIEIIGLVYDVSILPNIIKYLDSESLIVKSSFISILGWLNASEYVDDIILYLSSENENLRMSAVGSLSLINNKKVIDFCKENINSDNIRTQLSCIQLIALIGDSENISVYKKINYDNCQNIVKLAVVQSLGYLKTEQSIDLLLLLLDGSDKNLKQNIIQSLSKIKSKKTIKILLDLLKEKDMWIKYYVIQSLGNIADDSITDLLLLELKTDNPLIIIAVLETVNKLKINIKPHIPLLLKNENEDVKIEVIKIIGNFKYQEFIEDLLLLLNEENWKIKIATIKAIINISDSKNVFKIIDIYNATEDELIKEHIIKNIYKIDIQKVFDFLIFSLLHSKSFENCYTSLLKMNPILIDSYIENFSKLTNDMKIIIVKLLGDYKISTYNDFLISLLKTDDALLKYDVIISMQKIKNKIFIDYLLPIAFPDDNIIELAKNTIKKIQQGI